MYFFVSIKQLQANKKLSFVLSCPLNQQSPTFPTPWTGNGGGSAEGGKEMISCVHLLLVQMEFHALLSACATWFPMDR